MKSTRAVRAIATALLEADEVGERTWGWRLQGQVPCHTVTMYEALNRMLTAGWLVDLWEDPESTTGRPARRYYRLTDAGRRACRAAIDTPDYEEVAS